ncbi:uncharacterized protein LOC122509872 [Leptopilina heterotoma]|uniref:uncharacterized protein LOC122509872 n=1 Tax=Leptopilina heterotoma TaxID=63436 RepID=UPI001CA9814F|nr:uncharacterized protein LOC122509872 [Leptopilina heterotoma]
MRRLSPQEIKDNSIKSNYIPHHGIWQRNDDSKKLRVVFNASRPTSSGHSLNDALYAGPKLQSDIATVVTHWRQYKVAYCADIKMMFRQIRIRPEDTHLQRIIWSPDPDQPEEHFALLTVTFGEACSPYLALRTLKQLCEDEGGPYPEAVKSIQDDLYVDDFLSGGRNLKDARQRRDQLIQLLKRGGFELKKWVSNRPELLEDIPPSDRLRPSWRHFEVGGLVTELGLAWDPVADKIRFSPPKLGQDEVITKRKALSELAKLFDPIGWLAPLIVVGKMHIQDLWRAKLPWDEQLPKSMNSRWMKFREDVSKLDILSVPRWINFAPGCPMQLHVFADASRRAMAATVYSCTKNSAHLLAAKTKLSPIKSLIPTTKPNARMTIPRLELRAALLGAKLIQLQAEALGVKLHDCFAWSDSQVELLPGVKWRYVPSETNPADLATRGTDIEGLASNRLWWQGPSWLQQNQEEWPQEISTSSANVPNNETLPSLHCLATQATETIFDRFSSLIKLQRALVRCRRIFQSPNTQVDQIPPLAPTTTEEMKREFLTCVKMSQEQDFSHEIQLLGQGKFVSVGSAIARLKPFLDEQTILRVGGRLENSSLNDEEKHPPPFYPATVI